MNFTYAFCYFILFPKNTMWDDFEHKVWFYPLQYAMIKLKHACAILLVLGLFSFKWRFSFSYDYFIKFISLETHLKCIYYLCTTKPF